MDAMKYSTSPWYFLGLPPILKASVYTKTSDSDKWIKYSMVYHEIASLNYLGASSV